MKTILTISVDPEVLLEIRRKNINTSGLINIFLKSYLGIKTKDLPEHHYQLLEEIKVRKAALFEAEKALEKKKKKTVIITGGK